MQESESGYKGKVTDDSDFGAALTDVEILSVSGTNIIARGRRFGRFWLLKGINPELKESLAAPVGSRRSLSCTRACCIPIS